MDDLQSRKMYSISTGLLIGWEGYFILMVASSIRWCPTQGRISETTFALINRDFMQTSAWSWLSKCHFVIFYSCYANITHFFAKKIKKLQIPSNVNETSITSSVRLNWNSTIDMIIQDDKVSSRLELFRDILI